MRILLAALLILAAPPAPQRTVPGITIATICSTHWGRDARHVTVKMKRAAFLAAGIPFEERASYETDHIFSRELGGADTLANLQVQCCRNPATGQITGDAHEKDVLENKLHRDLCASPPRVTLSEARRQVLEFPKHYPRAVN